MTDTADTFRTDNSVWLSQETLAERFAVDVDEVKRLVQGCALPGDLRFSDRRVRVRRADLREWSRHFEPVKETR